MLHILNTSKEGFVANILFCVGCKREMNTLHIMLVKFQVNIQNMDMNFLCAPLCVQLLDLGEYPIQLWQHMATIANRMAMTATMHKPYMRHPFPSLCIAPICVLANIPNIDLQSAHIWRCLSIDRVLSQQMVKAGLIAQYPSMQAQNFTFQPVVKKKAF